MRSGKNDVTGVKKVKMVVLENEGVGHNMHIMCKKDEGIVMPNFAARSASVFQLSRYENSGGGYPAPPVGARCRAQVERSSLFDPEFDIECQVLGTDNYNFWNHQYLRMYLEYISVKTGVPR